MEIRNLFRLPSILLYLLSILVFFLVGLFTAQLTGAGKNQMLAGGAIVFFYGVVSASTALILSFLMAYYFQQGIIKTINKILGLVLIILSIHIVWTVSIRQKKTDQQENRENKTTIPVASGMISEAIQSSASMGLGIFIPDFTNSKTLYFFGSVNSEKSRMEHHPTDSIVFTYDQNNNPTTSYAPPWLFPEHLKLDYGIIQFKVLGINSDFVKVEGNRQTHTITWLDKYQGRFISWAEFILTVNSVEFLDKDNQIVQARPLESSDPVVVDFAFMQPLLVEEDWMYVGLLDMNRTVKGKGWIQWRKDKRLLVSYSLLS